MKPTVLILRHMLHEPGGTLETALTNAGLTFRYVDLFQELPARLPLDESAGLIVLGGAMNVDQTEQYPFLTAEVKWIEQALSAELPLLGICLGSQLLAKTLGAKVYPGRRKEIGWYSVELMAAAADDRLFAQSGVRTVFQWHGDTFDLPAGAAHLARSPVCENQAFRYGRGAYGLQFHIEMTAAMIDDWLTEAGNCRELARVRLHRPSEHRRPNPGRVAAIASTGSRCAGTVRPDVPR